MAERSDQGGEEAHSTDESKASVSKARDESLHIQPYNFFSYSQFGVTAGYIDKCDEVSGGSCWSWCYQAVWHPFDLLANRLGNRPPDEEVVKHLDRGHASFYSRLAIAKAEGLLTEERMDDSIRFWSDYFDEWRDWFRVHYPKYFWPALGNSEDQSKSD